MFTVERTHIPNASNIFLAFLCLWATGPDGTNERIIIQSGLRNDSWTLEFVDRNAIIWLRNWERQQLLYPPTPEDQPHEEWRHAEVEAALRDLTQLYPGLAEEDFS